MAKAVFRKSNGVLVPTSDDAEKIIASVKDGQEVMVDVRTARNPGQHRLFFVMLKKVIDSGCWDYDEESLLTWVKFRVGHVNVVTVNDRQYISPKSISFENMEQPEFQKFFDRAIYRICHELASPELASELNNIIESRYGDRRNM